MYSLEKQKQESQISSKIDENNEQVNTGMIEGLKTSQYWYDRGVENKNSSPKREERDDNKKLLNDVRSK